VLETECKGGEQALKEVTKKMNRLQYMQVVHEETNLEVKVEEMYDFTRCSRTTLRRRLLTTLFR
jgi:hypothetical protein